MVYRKLLFAWWKDKNRLVIENDDKIYNIEEVLDIGIKLKVPVIFDNLRNQLNPSEQKIMDWTIQGNVVRKGPQSKKLLFPASWTKEKGVPLWFYKH